MSDRRWRRHSYDRIAQLYDRARPGYPPALFDDIAAYASLDGASRVLEIGCGSGQATLPLARRGYAIDCIELGARLADIARHKLASFPRVRVIRGDFDRLAMPPAAYNLVMSATAFHWLDARTRFQKAHDLLAAESALALFWHRPALTDLTRHTLAPLQAIYAREAPQLTHGFQTPPPPQDVATEYDQSIAASGLFTDITIKKRYVATEYTATGYCELLETFSDHQALAADARRRLLAGIEALIEREFGGAITRETVALLYLARRM